MGSVRIVIVAALAIALHTRTADACSVCLAGDPSFSAHGTSSQAAGSVAVYVELRGWEKKSGRDDPHAHEELAERTLHMKHDGHSHEAEEAAAEEAEHEHGGRESHASRRLDLYVAWTPLDRLTLTLDAPWTANDITDVEAGESTHLALSGLGDVSLGVGGVVWRNRPVLPSTWLELRAWGKAPTGRDEKSVDGERDPHLQTGTGSWDFGVGAAGVHRFEWASVYTSVFHRFNTEGGLEYEYGDVLLATAALEVPLGHATGVHALDRLTPGLGFDFRYAARDRQEGHGVEDTGGSILYVSPSLRITLPAFGETQRAWLRTGVQIPVTNEWLYDVQDEGPVWSIGLGYAF